MRCSQCNESKQTVAELRVCGQCSKDGTASQLTEYADAARIEDVIAAHPGIGNRFLPETGEPELPVADDAQSTAKPTKRKARPVKKPVAAKRPSKGAQALKRKEPPKTTPKTKFGEARIKKEEPAAKRKKKSKK